MHIGVHDVGDFRGSPLRGSLGAATRATLGFPLVVNSDGTLRADLAQALRSFLNLLPHCSFGTNQWGSLSGNFLLRGHGPSDVCVFHSLGLGGRTGTDRVLAANTCTRRQALVTCLQHGAGRGPFRFLFVYYVVQQYLRRRRAGHRCVGLAAVCLLMAETEAVLTSRDATLPPDVASSLTTETERRPSRYDHEGRTSEEPELVRNVFGG